MASEHSNSQSTGCASQRSSGEGKRLTAVLSFDLAKASYAAAKDECIATHILWPGCWEPAVTIQG